MEAGWQPVEGPTGTVHAAELHYEQINPALAAIDGITVTHGNDHSPIQAFRWGSVAIGMQFHPEWSHQDTGAVLERHREVLSAHHRGVASVHRSVAGAARRGADLFRELVVDPISERLGALPATSTSAMAG